MQYANNGLMFTFAGNTRLPINHRQRVSSNGTLVLSAVDPVYDEGVYSCDARDSNGHGSRQSVYIHVMGRHC